MQSHISERKPCINSFFISLQGGRKWKRDCGAAALHLTGASPIYFDWPCLLYFKYISHVGHCAFWLRHGEFKICAFYKGKTRNEKQKWNHSGHVWTMCFWKPALMSFFKSPDVLFIILSLELCAAMELLNLNQSLYMLSGRNLIAT